MANPFDQFDGKNEFDRFDAPAKPKTNPILDSPVGGLMRGARDVLDGAAQIAARVVAPSRPPYAGYGSDPYRSRNLAVSQMPSVQDIDRVIVEAERDYRENWRGGSPPSFDTGRVVGNVLGPAPLAAAVRVVAPTLGARLAAGAMGGAATGAAMPVLAPAAGDGDFWTQKANQAALGGATGAAGSAVMSGVGRMLNPQTRPEVTDLLRRGVTPTPGQAAGGAVRRVEEGLKSVPFLGDSIKAGERRAVDQFNRAAIDDVLAPLGKSLPKDASMGHKAVEAAGDMVSDSYNTLLPKLVARVDQKFAGDLGNLANLSQNMNPAQAAQFKRILDNQLVSKFSQGGVISGESIKTAESQLGRFASDYLRSSDADQRMLGSALREAQSILRGLVERSNPQYAKELTANNAAWARLVRVERAAGYQNAADGVFSPAQFMGAVRGADNSMRKRSFARGNALMQDLAESGKTVLGNTVPDSGTPFRLTNMGLMGGGYMLDPTIPIGIGAASALYSSPAQKALTALIAQRPDALRAAGRGATAAAPRVGAALAPLGLLSGL